MLSRPLHPAPCTQLSLLAGHMAVVVQAAVTGQSQGTALSFSP